MGALQGELTGAYRDKASLAEASLAATRQLAVVRDLHERQGAELAEAAEEVRQLRAALGALRAEAEHHRGAHALASRELEVRGGGRPGLRGCRVLVVVPGSSFRLRGDFGRRLPLPEASALAPRCRRGWQRRRRRGARRLGWKARTPISCGGWWRRRGARSKR